MLTILFSVNRLLEMGKSKSEDGDDDSCHSNDDERAPSQQEMTHRRNEIPVTSGLPLSLGGRSSRSEGATEAGKVSPSNIEREATPGAVEVTGGSTNDQGSAVGGAGGEGTGAQYENSVPDESASPSIHVTGSLDTWKSRTSTGNSSVPGAVAVAGVMSEVDTNRDTQIDNEASLQASAVSAADEANTDENEMPSGSEVAREAEGGHSEGRIDTTVSDNDTEQSVPTIVQAELVALPVEALYVAIDEEQIISSTSSQHFEMEQFRNSAVEGNYRKKYTPVFWLLLALVVLLVVCAITVPMVILRENETDALAFPPSMAPTFSYPCYTSTLDILEGQLFDAEQSEAYIMCPDTFLKLGTFRSPAIDDYRFVRGDYPLVVVRENVTIQCGLDGRHENKCVLDGGFMHVLILQKVPLPDGSTFEFHNPIDNRVIRGFTFTGDPEDIGPFDGLSVSLAHPGRNLRFEDCIWTDLTSSSGLIGVQRNTFQFLADLPLDDRSIDVTFSDCVFQNIVYDFPLISTVAQTIHLERCMFRNISLSRLVSDRCQSDDGSGAMEFYNGCAALLACSSTSSCFMEDMCVQNFDFYGPGLVLTNEETEFDYDGLYWDAPEALETPCEMAVISKNLDTANATCSDIFTEPICPLLLP